MSSPSAPGTESPRWQSLVWNKSQRRAIVVLLTVLWLLLVIRYMMNRQYVSDPQPPTPSRSAELADRIDPNTATWQDLAALPNLGEKRAQAITAYRESHQAASLAPVFKNADDLLVIRGIGVATVTKLRPYLVFPGPATAPAVKQ